MLYYFGLYIVIYLDIYKLTQWLYTLNINFPYQYNIVIRAGSGISGSRVPDNCLGYPNPKLSSGTRKIALWVDFFLAIKHLNDQV